MILAALFFLFFARCILRSLQLTERLEEASLNPSMTLISLLLYQIIERSTVAYDQ